MDDFQIGDWVVIVGWSPYWDGVEGQVSRTDSQYVWITGTDDKLKQHGREAGFGRSLLSRETSYHQARKVLGEDYFA